MSSFMNILATLFLLAEWIVSWITSIPSRIDLPGTKPICSLDISLESIGLSRFAKILDKNLYIVLYKAIGLKSPGFQDPLF